jgi:hypothetical protein
LEVEAEECCKWGNKFLLWVFKDHFNVDLKMKKSMCSQYAKERERHRDRERGTERYLGNWAGCPQYVRMLRFHENMSLKLCLDSINNMLEFFIISNPMFSLFWSQQNTQKDLR